MRINTKENDTTHFSFYKNIVYKNTKADIYSKYFPKTGKYLLLAQTNYGK